jgi:hypothetical protein
MLLVVSLYADVDFQRGNKTNNQRQRNQLIDHLSTRRVPRVNGRLHGFPPYGIAVRLPVPSYAEKYPDAPLSSGSALRNTLGSLLRACPRCDPLNKRQRFT